MQGRPLGTQDSRASITMVRTGEATGKTGPTIFLLKGTEVFRKIENCGKNQENYRCELFGTYSDLHGITKHVTKLSPTRLLT